MNRSSFFVIMVSLVAILIAAFVACCSCSPPTPPCQLDLPVKGPKVEQISRIYYRREKPSEPLSWRVQLLTDGSGSMNGFRSAVTPLQLWMRQGISVILGSYIQLRNFRACYFSGRLDSGFGGCSADFNTAQPAVDIKGNTNLHSAIHSARDFDLTMLLTDGVAYTGAGTGDCAGGVDAACVARSLLEVVRSYQVVSPDELPGIWIFPLISQFEGIFYSEQTIRSQDFAAQSAVERIQKDVRQLVTIQNVRQTEAGELIYEYQGPRVIFLVIIARRHDIGLATVHSLWEQMQQTGINRLETITDWKAGIGAFHPVEIFPGSLPRIEWQNPPDPFTSAIPSQRNFCGLVGLTELGQFARDKSIKLECRSAKSGEVLLRLPFRQTEGQPQFVPIGMLAPFRFDLRPSTGSMLVSYDSSWKEARLDLHLKCAGPTGPSGSGSGTVKYAWIASPDLAKAADCLANPVGQDCSSDDVLLLRTLNADNPAGQPHRSFGLIPTLRFFLNDAKDLAAPSTIAELSISGEARK